MKIFLKKYDIGIWAVALGSCFSTSESQPLVYHLNFDNLKAGLIYTEDEVKADLKVANGTGFADRKVNPTEETNRAGIDATVDVYRKGNSLKVRFPKNKLKTSASGIDARVPLQGTYKDNPFKASELFLSYWIKFSSNFDFSKCGGKLPSLGGDYVSTGDRWKGRIMWRNKGSIQFYPELAGGEDKFTDNSDRFWGTLGANISNICTGDFSSYLGNKSWHNIELHYKFETPGKNDGFFEGWIDGNKGHKVTNSDRFGFWRPAAKPDDININYLLLSTFLGGSDLADYAMNEDTFVWFDEFKVSYQRINEYSKVTGTTTLLRNGAEPFLGKVQPLETKGLFQLERSETWEAFSTSGKSVAKGYGDKIDLINSTSGLYLLKISGQTILILR